ncbi:ABC transporter ATP-binding protein [Tropicimonas sediminicola]|uniref:Peptide/nickel transport system ATP-binding protein n=1 Tax=Tropicimonas sediminicola TaxID=1031541 RepID=A0A239J7D6_9RHOB|nr:ABC transporter ATP-binding protein [Tropicimonas sediminicola]SNT01750.1 peptide/nickel transport system ATP-binding protein [Tropicimonas sediminicola]
MTPALSLRDYALHYDTPTGPVRILDGISLDIGRGEVLGLVGESGSAKSSLANAVIRDLPGKVHAEHGTITLAGDDITALPEAELGALRGRRIAMVFQNAATTLDPVQTLGDHLLETLGRHTGLAPAARRDRALELLGMVGLPDPAAMMARYPHEVSGGEKQRVVLALAFGCEPELILFDEPTSALDATTAATLLDLFRDLQARTGVSALFISHDLGTVAEIAHRVAVIYGGRIVEEGPTEAIFAGPKHPYTQALLASLPRPSDRLEGRGLATSGARPAPRRGEMPPCLFSASCPHHDPSVCDVQRVHPSHVEDRQIACARVARGETLPAPQAPAPLQSPRGETALLEARGLSVTYGRTALVDRLRGRATPQVRAVRDVSFRLNRGETLALVGESGCGKSSLARALSGLQGFTGETMLAGTPTAPDSAAWRARVQTIFQNPDSSLNPRHTLATILGRPLKLFRPEVDRPAEIARLLERVHLPADYATRYPHQLSGGEKQRVAIARALAAEPDVIICDEITSGLDAAVQAAIVRLLREIQATTGAALVFITHDLGILRHIADRLAVMYLGEMVETCEIAALDAAPWHPYTEALLSSSHSVDPGSDTRRVRLQGSLPKRTEDVSGCPFASRCPRHIGPDCDSSRPPLRAPEPGHDILCHLSDAALNAVPPIWQFKTSDTTRTTQ